MNRMCKPPDSGSQVPRLRLRTESLSDANINAMPAPAMLRKALRLSLAHPSNSTDSELII